MPRRTQKHRPEKKSTKPAIPLHPVLYTSRPAAGFPAPGDDQVEERLDTNAYLVPRPTSTFFVRVEGDSMEGAGILSGDVLSVDRSLEPTPGNIVVAAVFGELVVKRVEWKGKRLILASANPRYEPISLDNSDDCSVWGVVVGLARKLHS